MLSHLLKLGADHENITDDHEPPLHLAARYDRANDAKYLLDYGTNTNTRDRFNPKLWERG